MLLGRMRIPRAGAFSVACSINAAVQTTSPFKAMNRNSRGWAIGRPRSTMKKARNCNRSREQTAKKLHEMVSETMSW